MKRKSKWMGGITLILAVVFVVFVTRCSEHSPSVPQVKVTQRTIVDKVTAVGNIVPRHIITVRSALDGIVDTIFQDSGHFVKRGQPLLQVKPNTAPGDLAQAIALVKQDQGRVAADKQAVASDRYLIKNKIVTKNYASYLTDLATLSTDQAKLHYDQQNLDLKKKGQAIIDGKHEKGIIASPIDGYILQRNVDAGDTIASVSSLQSATTLFTIANMSDLIFKGSVDEVDASKIHLHMPVTVQVGAIPGLNMQGKLDKLAMQSDEQNALYSSALTSTASSGSASPFNVGFQVEVANLNPPKNVNLLSGYSATATFVFKKEDHVLALPERVIQFKGKLAQVEVINARGKKRTMPVQLGLSDGEYVQIKQGLHLGDQVVDISQTGGA